MHDEVVTEQREHLRLEIHRLRLRGYRVAARVGRPHPWLSAVLLGRAPLSPEMAAKIDAAIQAERAEQERARSAAR